jgi:hypothetical protein
VSLLALPRKLICCEEQQGVFPRPDTTIRAGGRGFAERTSRQTTRRPPVPSRGTTTRGGRETPPIDLDKFQSRGRSLISRGKDWAMGCWIGGVKNTRRTHYLDKGRPERQKGFPLPRLRVHTTTEMTGCAAALASYRNCSPGRRMHVHRVSRALAAPNGYRFSKRGFGRHRAPIGTADSSVQAGPHPSCLFWPRCCQQRQFHLLLQPLRYALLQTPVRVNYTPA